MKIKTAKMISMLLVAGGIIVGYYPQIADYVNSYKTVALIKQYINDAGTSDTENVWKTAVKYNEKLTAKVTNNISEVKDIIKQYNNILNIDGIMGYIDIPSISVKLPIYHGTSDEVLQKGVGHLSSTALPVGGCGTHCVLAAHTGLVSSKMFNKLEDVAVRDKFYITAAGHTLVYEVDDVQTVLPSEVDLLQPIEDRDLCTLVTCTPYGINSHRLLVRGIRVKESAGVHESKVVGRRKNVTIIMVIGSVLSALIILEIIWSKYEKKSKVNDGINTDISC